MTILDVQRVSLEILKDVHEFCVENNIRYSLAYGTLLGAIRHNGFIPWDVRTTSDSSVPISHEKAINYLREGLRAAIMYIGVLLVFAKWRKRMWIRPIHPGLMRKQGYL